jgi:hypothetical protein
VLTAAVFRDADAAHLQEADRVCVCTAVHGCISTDSIDRSIHRANCVVMASSTSDVSQEQRTGSGRVYQVAVQTWTSAETYAVAHLTLARNKVHVVDVAVDCHNSLLSFAYAVVQARSSPPGVSFAAGCSPGCDARLHRAHSERQCMVTAI